MSGGEKNAGESGESGSYTARPSDEKPEDGPTRDEDDEQVERRGGVQKESVVEPTGDEARRRGDRR